MVMNQASRRTIPDPTVEEQRKESRPRRSVSIIIPVYNDKESILPTKTKLEEVLQNTQWQYEIIFVDDGSTDGARELLDNHQLRHISHSRNRGYGAAVKTGVSAAESDYVCIIDCDLTYPPEEIPNLLRYIGQYSMVTGARKRFGEPLLHYLGRVFICAVLNTAFGQKVLDINSGLRIFETEVFREYMPALCDRFSLTGSITFGFLLDRRPMKYVPIRYDKRVGKTKVRNLSYVWSFAKSYVRMYRFHRRKKRT